MLEELKKKVADVANRLASEELVRGASGNVSTRDEETGLVVITPTKAALGSVTPDILCVVDMDGNVLEGGKPSSSTKFHLKIMKNRPEIKAVVHTHSPYATAFSVANEAIPVINIEVSSKIRGDIKVSPYAQNGSDIEAENITATLGKANAVLMQNHGAVAVAEDLDKALLNSFIVEEAAKMYSIVRSMGSTATTIEPKK